MPQYQPAHPDCVFFDFDGVIVDSVEAKIEAFGELYAEFGPGVRSIVEGYQRAVPGETRYAKIPRFHRELLGIELSEPEIREWAGRLRDIVVDRVIACPLLPGVDETLSLLARRGIPAHVVSGTPEDELAVIAEARGLAPFFRSMRGSPRAKSDIVGEILGREDYAPRSCLFVGDATSDLACARECGLDFVGVAPTETHPFPEETRVVRNLLEIFGPEGAPDKSAGSRAA